MARRTSTARRTQIVIAIAALSALAACKTSTKPADLNQAPGSSAAASSAAAGSGPASTATSAATQASTAASSAAAESSATQRPAIRSAISPVPALPSLAPSTTPTPSSATPKASPSTSGPTSSPGQRNGSPKPPVGITVPSPTATAPAALTGQKLTGKVIVLDPGHNLNNSSSINKNVYAGNGVYKACDTTGTATDAGYPEHAFTWDVANRTAAILRAEGATVILTRPNDASIGPCITTRAQIGNDAHANAFVAIHADGGPAGGHGFFVMQPPPSNPNVNPGGAPQSRILATVMHDTFHAVTGIPYSTYIANGYYPNTTTTGTINLSHGPVITIECLNMRNSGDAAIAANPMDRQTIAAGIAAGLTAFLTR
jgi:N-acetylmuramoyl-L-alanine amidase